MVKHRSAPADIIRPHLVYEDVPGAHSSLTNTFGFIEHSRYGGPGGPARGAQTGCHTQSLTVFVDDCDAHFDRAKSAGAKIVEDLEGHLWLFSRHARDVGPGEWGAAIAPAAPDQNL